MKNSMIVGAIIASLSVSGIAMAAIGDFAKIDANTDGKITLEEGMTRTYRWIENQLRETLGVKTTQQRKAA